MAGLLLMVLTCLALVPTSHARNGTYQDQTALLKTLFASTRYNPNLRPLHDQRMFMIVTPYFELVSIVEINDLHQSFVCNGFLVMYWLDELLRWNISDYGGSIMFSIDANKVFHPRLTVLNTLVKADLKTDDVLLNVFSDGLVQWYSGEIFTASCRLDLTVYPFDEQVCSVKLVSMNYMPLDLVYKSPVSEIYQNFFIQNREWEVLSGNLTTPMIDVNGVNFSSIMLTFHLKRRPEFLVLSSLLPVVFISLLNLFVFIIPADSGEKISYGITVLLALAVYMSILSADLPRASGPTPLVIIYILILLIVSVLTVVGAIIIVKLHHMEENVDKSNKAKQFESVPNIANILPFLDVGLINCDPKVLEKNKNKQATTTPLTSQATSRSPAEGNEGEGQVNKFRVIGKYIDLVSAVIFGIVWFSVNIGFFSVVLNFK